MTKKHIILSKELLEDLRQLNILDEIALRNEAIIREFYKRLKKGKQRKGEIKIQLAEEYNLGYKLIDYIVYQKKRRRKPPCNPIRELL
jgi:hypothetical protein